MTLQELKAMNLALEALMYASYEDIEYNDACAAKVLEARNALKEALAQPEQEPVAFEEWLAKQHGDPEEIGFLQALRIAYLAGQDSITHPPQRTEPLQQKKVWTFWDLSGGDIADAIKAKLKEKNT